MKISIITVCLNSRRTISKTIESVLSQTYQNIEYIVIDGNSVDGTQDIVEKYIADNKTNVDIKFISEPDKGIYDAMNKGLRIATGDCIGFINSDDWYETDTVENVVNGIPVNTQKFIVCGDLKVINQEDTATFFRTDKNIDNIRYKMVCGHPTCFVSRAAYEEVGWYDTQYKIAADYDWLVRMYLNKVQFVFLDKILANFGVEGISSKRYLECEKEHTNISIKYFPNDHEVFKERLVSHAGCYIKNAIENKRKDNIDLHYEKNSVALFGAGIWGKRVYSFLKLHGIDIDYVFDNGRKEELCGHSINDQTLLDNYDGIVIVTIRNGEIVERQLLKKGNKQIRVISLEDFLVYVYSEYCKLDKDEAYYWKLFNGGINE